MSFDRSRVQLKVESTIGCRGSYELNLFKDQLNDFQLSRTDLGEFSTLANQDSRDLFFKGFLSIAQAILDLNHGLHSWAIPKLYYGTFFLVKASLGLRGYAILRNHQTIRSLQIKVNGKSAKVNQGRASGDHKLTFVAWRKLIGESEDILLSNTIEGDEAYIWLMHLREQVQYKQRNFTEPNASIHFPNEKDLDIADWIEFYVEDNTPVYCFDPEHAALALPIKRLIYSYNDLVGEGLDLTASEKVVLRTLLAGFIKPKSKLHEIIG